jgi:intracellular sulfur oxidation DsrE/DsrF family protein
VDGMENIKKLEELCRPIVNYLKENYNPHCEVVISQDAIRLVSTEIGIPVKKEND